MNGATGLSHSSTKIAVVSSLRRGSVAGSKKIGERKNHGSSAAERIGATSRKYACRTLTASARPSTNANRQSEHERQREQRRAGAADRDRDRRQQRDEREERHELHGHDRRRDRLAREARLAHERAVIEQRRRRAQHRLAEEDPHDEADEQKQRVVLRLVGPGDLEQHAEHEVVRAHEHERVDEVPQDPEGRALVLLAQLAPDHLLEQVPIGHAAIIVAGRGARPARPRSSRKGRPRDATLHRSRSPLLIVMKSAIALVHSRFSTNTFPSWPLAHPSFVGRTASSERADRANDKRGADWPRFRPLPGARRTSPWLL